MEASKAPPNRFHQYWFHGVLFSLSVTATLLFLELQDPACHCGCTCEGFPAVPASVWMAYVAAQLLNRIPVGWKWKNDWRQTSERLWFVVALLVFIAAFTIRTQVHAGFWIAGSLGVAGWIVHRSIQLLVASRHYPLMNRLVALGIGILFDSPILMVTAMALAESR